jgi:hypothetical protein
MSLTPDWAYDGESVCSLCDKPMFANDQGIVFAAKQGHKMFCTCCAVQLVMSVGQDIKQITPEVAFSYYRRFKEPVVNMRRHAKAMHELGTALDDWASAVSYNMTGQTNE